MKSERTLKIKGHIEDKNRKHETLKKKKEHNTKTKQHDGKKESKQTQKHTNKYLNKTSAPYEVVIKWPTSPTERARTMD